MLKLNVLLIGLLFNFSGFGQNYSQFENILMSVGKSDIGGSGLLMCYDKQIYCVTAKHNILDSSDNLLVKYSEWSFPKDDLRSGTNVNLEIFVLKLFQKKKIFFDKMNDIVAIEIGILDNQIIVLNDFASSGELESLHHNIYKKDEHLSLDFIYGETIFTAGYPLSIGSVINREIQRSQYDENLPIIQSCIISQLNRNRNTAIIDCTSYPGYSGGAVIRNNKLVGIISQRIPFKDKSIPLTQKFEETTIFSVVVPINSIYELVKQ